MKVGRVFVVLDDPLNALCLRTLALVLLFSTLSTTAAHCANTSFFSLIFSGGANYGCLVPKEPVDGVSGASKWGGQGGVHAEMGINGHFFETGFDYSYFNNDVTYKDAGNDIDGTRALSVHGLAIPIMYNFHLFKRKNGDPNLILGIGLLGSYFPYVKVGETGTLSDFSSRNWSAGPCLRISCYPLEIQEKYLPGLYMGLYRSLNPFYTDDYFDDGRAAVWGIFNIGVSLKMKL